MPRAHSLSISLLLAGLLAGGAYGQSAPAKKDVRAEVVPVKFSRVVAGFGWAATVSPAGLTFQLPGSVMDNSDDLFLREELLLPGVVLDQYPSRILIGLSWLWPAMTGDDVEVHIILPGQPPVACRPVGLDETIGLMLLEAVETRTGSAPGGLKIETSAVVRTNPAPVFVVSAREQAICLTRATRKPAGGIQVSGQANLPPFLLPVISRDGLWEGYLRPSIPGPAPSGGEPEPFFLSAEDIGRRLQYLLTNQAVLQSGYLGVYLGQASSAVDSLVYVRGVVADSPADAGDLRAGDVIRIFNGQPVHSQRQLMDLIARQPPRSPVEVLLQRDGGRLLREVVMGQRRQTVQDEYDLVRRELQQIQQRSIQALPVEKKMEGGSAPEWSNPTMGLFMQDLSGGLLELLGRTSGGGALITFVMPGFPASRAGLQAGDLIIVIGGRPIERVRDVFDVLRAAQAGQKLTIGCLRNGELRQSVIELR